MGNKDCIFCKIVKGEVSAKKEMETDDLNVIWDIKPQADVHLLLIPRKHVQDLRFASDNLWLKIKAAALRIAKEKKLNSFRLVHNVGAAAEIKHFHVHFLAEVSPERVL